MALLDLFDVALFVRAASQGSLSRAARALGLTPGAASRRLDGLERHLRTRLLNRSTRGLKLTAEGQAFLERARGLLAAAEEAEESVGTRQDASGLLRVTAPPTFVRKVIAPILPTLMARPPPLRVDRLLTACLADTAQSGIGRAIRRAPPTSSTLAMPKLADDPPIVCAAPAYIERH